MVRDLAEGFPFALKFGIGYASVEPGKAPEARKIFINDATNGIPEKGGQVWDFSFDVMKPVKLPLFKQAYLFGGPRYAMFKGNFKYVCGNEDFNITSKQWGVDSGLENHFPINQRFDLILTGGLDYYFESALYGHDTSYDPNGEDVNPREDYTYADANDAVSQPEYELRVMFGINYHF
jgi:hypothetical protein